MKRRRFSKNQNHKFLFAFLMGMGVSYAESEAIIGGQTSSGDAYSSFVSSSGSLTPIPNLPSSSEIYGVSINEYGFGLVVGQENGDGYAALVAPDGTLTPLSVSFPTGTILSTSINSSGNGLIGGAIGTNGGFYAALVSPEGTITTLSPDALAISSVSLNADDVGLMGGEGVMTNSMYAAYVVDGNLIPLSLPDMVPGHIYGVDLNSLGTGIVGGNTGNTAYAAFVTAADSIVLLNFTPPGAGASNINSVAINRSGIGLIGGYDANGDIYAGYSDPDGNVTTIFGSPFPGFVNSVSMNDSGTGLIGGQNGSDLYAAFVFPTGGVNPLFSQSISGEIRSVALSQSGIGIVGGQQGSSAYAALVAPNGTLTVLDVSDETIIRGVDFEDLVNSATPQSFGLYLSTIYTHLSMTYALDARFSQHNRMWTPGNGEETAHATFGQRRLLASNEPDFGLSTGCDETVMPSQNSIWVAPFGNYVHLKDQGTIPSYTNEIGGALLGYDRTGCNYLVGASLGYAFNYIHYSESLGHGKVQEEVLSLYGSYYTDHFRLNGALWGGLYQFWNVRHTLSLITSKANSHGWILDPHLEMASPWSMSSCDCYFVEPFFMLDWINSWQHHFTESGDAGFNLQVGSLYGSLLQSEVGLRFYEQWEYGWGSFCLLEKLSYVNQAPFHFNSTTTSFVGSASTFPIAVASSRVENLGAFQLKASFIPQSSCPYFEFMGQVMANSSYQSYFVSLNTGFDF